MPEILKPASQIGEVRREPTLELGWVDRYELLGLAKLSDTSRRVVTDDARFITEKCILRASDDGWPSSRVRTGIVVGSVQSGKTASMLAVSARLLDRGLDILIVLAGTRIALWGQTYERFLRDLDGTDNKTFRLRKQQRLLVPHPAILEASARPGAPNYMAREVSTFRRSLQRERPIVMVIPKVEDHLLAVSRFLEEQLGGLATERTIEMVVLDDEADDGSVLDSRQKKIIPRRVEMLWTGRRPGESMHSNLYATYVAYTATPQANFLQADHNALAPRDFCAALRTPYKCGSLKRRQVTFQEPLGLPGYYCGGEMFYAELAASGGALTRCVPFPQPGPGDERDHVCRVRASSDALTLDCLRSFLVSGAIRLLSSIENGGLRYSEIRRGFCRDDLSRIPHPHTMLVHPSARIDVHAREAWRLVLLTRGVNPDSPSSPPFVPEELSLSAEGLRKDLEAHPELWRHWPRDFAETRRDLELLPGAESLIDPNKYEWDEIRQTIEEEIIPHARLRIINSDPSSDDRPRFVPLDDGSDNLLPPPDILSILVSGNVMARGLTIEGLHSSVFTRPASEPAADTQMQMQRWFGYRGSNVHLCRLFCFDDQLELFRTYHEHDTALRREILAEMEDGSEETSLMVLTGSRSLATAKIRTTRLPLHPGPSPYLRILEYGRYAGHNAQILQDLLDSGTWQRLQTASNVLGRIREETSTLAEIAQLLDRFRYSYHDPSPNGGVPYSRWQSLEKQHSISQTLFRPPGHNPGTPAVDVRQCPYSIAAYLRLWEEALKRPRCDGLVATHSKGQPWSFVQPTLTPPRFYIGLRFGSLSGNSWENLGLLNGVGAMKRSADLDVDGVLRMGGSWGSRGKSGNYLGDQLFDYHHHGLEAPRLHDAGALWRPVGHPGLVLFQVVKTDHSNQDCITVGLALPHGGPEQFAAMSVAK